MRVLVCHGRVHQSAIEIAQSLVVGYIEEDEHIESSGSSRRFWAARFGQKHTVLVPSARVPLAGDDLVGTTRRVFLLLRQKNTLILYSRIEFYCLPCGCFYSLLRQKLSEMACRSEEV